MLKLFYFNITSLYIMCVFYLCIYCHAFKLILCEYIIACCMHVVNDM